ncbi:hypothetical protein [Aquiflexum sp.]|uniref:hypothetical protein n=1 Tax=Aquiflexum sp. TaxID=1872584 RepID=UPI0035930003
MEQLVIKDTALLLEKTFDLKIPERLSTEDELVALMIPIIHQMLNRNFEKLLQICYRVDLGENKLQQILHESDPEMMAFDLAKALVERQMLKIKIKRRYSEN